MAADPIASMLAAQEPAGYWQKPGPGYATKYRGTVWQLIFLDQLGADPQDERVARACEYVLSHAQAENGGFGASGVAGAGPPPSSRVIHCLNGNLLRALIGFGWLDRPCGRATMTAITSRARPGTITKNGQPAPSTSSPTSAPAWRSARAATPMATTTIPTAAGESARRSTLEGCIVDLLPTVSGHPSPAAEALSVGVVNIV